MEHRLGRFLLSGILAVQLAGAAVADEEPYRLGAEDRVRIRVTEWQPGRGEVHVWEALSGEFSVDASGRLSLPLVGGVAVAGLTVEQAGGLIGERLQRKVGLVQPPDAAVEVAQFRPIYVVGQVDKPGAYPFRPQITVLQAVSLAGGFYRPGNLGLQRLAREAIGTGGELRDIESERAALLARRARLTAEMRGEDAIRPPADVPADGDAMREERALFESRREALRSQLVALGQAKTLLETEIGTLQEKLVAQDRQIGLAKKDLGNVNGLVDRGLAVSARLLSLEQTVAQYESTRLDSQLAISRARQDIGRNDRAVLDLRNERQNRILTELRETQIRLAKLDQQAATARALLSDTQSAAPRLVREQEELYRRPPVYTLVRTGPGEAQDIKVGEGEALRPGDVLKVETAGPPAAGTRSEAGGLTAVR